jgi:hypothetical protein
VADGYRTPGSDGILADPLAARGVPDPQKYVWPKVIARLHRDPSDVWSRRMVAQFWDAGGDPAPHAASYYHFAAYGLVRILLGKPDAVGPHRRAILTRAMGEEQLFTGDGTENHIAMWRTSGYLFAQAAGDRRRMAQARRWIVRYSDRLYAVGQGEFDSSTYVAFTIASWLNLLDFAKDPEVRHRARAVVDFLAASLAVRWCNGAQAGGEKRGFAGSDRRAPAAYLGWVWWGDGLVPSAGFSQAGIHAAVAAVSDYRPPKAIMALARVRPQGEPEEYRVSKPDYSMRARSETREALCVGRHYSVGVLYSPTGGWGGGETQETLWKMVARSADGGCATISGAGASYAERNRYNGEGRGPWDQMAHHRDLVAQLTRVPHNAEAIAADMRATYRSWRSRNDRVTFAEPVCEPWCYASIPSDARLLVAGPWHFVEMGAAYAAVRPIGGVVRPAPTEAAQGTRVLRVDGVLGKVVGIAYEFGDRGSDGSFAGFVEAVASHSTLDTDGDWVRLRGRTGRRLDVRFNSSGRFRPPSYDWGVQPPWPSGEGHGRIPEIRQDGRRLDLNAPWPVYDGPCLTIRNRTMTIRSRDDVTEPYVMAPRSPRP